MLFSLVSGFFDSGLVVVVAIILVLLTTVLSFLLLVIVNMIVKIFERCCILIQVEYEWCQVLFKNNTVR